MTVDSTCEVKETIEALAVAGVLGEKSFSSCGLFWSTFSFAWDLLSLPVGSFLCRRVWCLFPHSPQVDLDGQLRERWLDFAHLKHKPLDKKMSYLSTGEAFKILWHFTAEWLPSHTGHGVIWGSGATVLLVSPGFVPDEKKDWPVLASLRRFGLVTRTRCSFVLVALFRSLLRASGENTGSLATSASCLTNWTKSLNPIGFWRFACSSWASLHYLTPE